ncbi:MAG: hypothetical protein Q9187_001412 [Circinaria calcarea]
MPITIHPAHHPANPTRFHDEASTSSSSLLKGACKKEHQKCAEILQSSFKLDPNIAIYPSDNGFVHGAIKAYNQHHHLVIRPEDIWFAILTQLSLYINAHAADLRGKFVSFEGKKELKVHYVGNRWTVDFADFALKISYLLKENVVDAELREWMIPAFSTTTSNDKVIASILMMGSMQKYFTYKCVLECGLPSVTLLGSKDDWSLILSKLEKLPTFGEEPAVWYTLLRPVVSRFVNSFDHPNSMKTIGFWNGMVSYDMGSGSESYTGWITAFCFWDRDGKCLCHTRQNTNSQPLDAFFDDEKEEEESFGLDGAIYHEVDSEDVAPGYTSVSVEVDDNGDEFKAMMVAGSVGIRTLSSGGTLGPDGEKNMDTIQAEAGWWMFQMKEEAERGQEGGEEEETRRVIPRGIGK